MSNLEKTLLGIGCVLSCMLISSCSNLGNLNSGNAMSFQRNPNYPTVIKQKSGNLLSRFTKIDKNNQYAKKAYVNKNTTNKKPFLSNFLSNVFSNDNKIHLASNKNIVSSNKVDFLPAINNRITPKSVVSQIPKSEIKKILVINNDYQKAYSNNPKDYVVAVEKPSEKISSKISSKYRTSYLVKYGDTLWKIAKKHGTSVNTLMSFNKLDSSNIKPRQIIYIP